LIFLQFLLKKEIGLLPIDLMPFAIQVDLSFNADITGLLNELELLILFGLHRSASLRLELPAPF